MTRNSPLDVDRDPIQLVRHPDGSATLSFDTRSPEFEIALLLRDILTLETGRDLTLADAMTLACTQVLELPDDAPVAPPRSSDQILARLRERRSALMGR